MPERLPYNKEGAFFVYDRIMNLLKHFSKGLDSTGTVSYTHLDVYKRQVFTGQRGYSPPSARTVLVRLRVGWVSSFLP